MRTPLVVGNWKMNLLRAEARSLTGAVADAAVRLGEGVDAGIAPPAIWMTDAVEEAAGRLRVYGQNGAAEASGAFTGETSPVMLRNAGAFGTLVGHSERRHVFGEDDGEVHRRLVAALAEDLSVILCVGETLDERRADQTLDVVRRQLKVALEGVSPGAELVVAYEPVWAIGTGETASPEQAQTVHAEIRRWWADRFDAASAESLRIQYGGSAKAANARELLGQPDVDGLLVGGASLKAGEFSAILQVAAEM